FKLSICLHGARERANDGHRRARPHVAVGPPSLATQITPDVGEVAMEKGNEIIDMAHTRRVLPSLAVLALLVAAWWAVVAATQSAIFPTPWQVVRGTLELIQDGTLWEHIGASLFRVGAGFFLAVVFAIPLGLWMGWMKGAFTTLNPIIQML